MAQKIINYGKYRHKVTLKNAPTDASRNDAGERTGSGTTIATVWAAKEDWAGREVDEFARETAETTTKFFIRWRADVTTSCQLFHGSTQYDIESVLDYQGTKRELVLLCKRVQ